MPRGVYKISSRYGFQWTDERVQQLIDLWPSGGTCAQIGAIMGTGRHQVSGKAHRLGLPPHPRHEGFVSHKAQRKREYDKTRDRTKRDYDHYVEPKATSRLGRGYIEPVEYMVVPVRLGKDKCRWVSQMPSQGRMAAYCDEPNVFGKSYCPHHHAIVVRPSKEDVPRIAQVTFHRPLCFRREILTIE